MDNDLLNVILSMSANSSLCTGIPYAHFTRKFSLTQLHRRHLDLSLLAWKQSWSKHRQKPFVKRCDAVMALLLEENHPPALTSVAVPRMLMLWVTQPKKQPAQRRVRTSDSVVEILWLSRLFGKVRWFSTWAPVLGSTVFWPLAPWDRQGRSSEST